MRLVLCCIVLILIASCGSPTVEEQDIQAAIKLATEVVKGKETSGISNAIIRGLQSCDSMQIVSSSFEFQQLCLPFLGWGALDSAEFHRTHLFASVFNVDPAKKLLVLGEGRGENIVSLYLIKRISSTKWTLKAYETLGSRTWLGSESFSYDTASRTAHVETEVVWSSDNPSIYHTLFYRVLDDTMVFALSLPTGGGTDIVVAEPSRSPNSPEAMFLNTFDAKYTMSGPDSIVTKLEYEWHISSKHVDAQSFSGLLEGSDELTYVWDKATMHYEPRSESLEKLNSIQYNSICTYSDMMGFQLEIDAYASSIEKKYPSTAAVFRDYFSE
jgi:hypothetical protein